jgi:hypothetical protein
MQIDFGWLVLGGVFAALGLIALFALMRMASEQDRAARRQQKMLAPYTEVTVTKDTP